MPSICQELSILRVGDTEMNIFELLPSESSQSSVRTCYIFSVLCILAYKRALRTLIWVCSLSLEPLVTESSAIVCTCIASLFSSFKNTVSTFFWVIPFTYRAWSMGISIKFICLFGQMYILGKHLAEKKT